eukprot:gene8645-biopygen6924
MATTRGKSKEQEVNRPMEPGPSEGNNQIGEMKSAIDSKKLKLQSVLKRLGYHNKSSERILTEGTNDQIIRQKNLLKSKLDEVYELMQEIQGLLIDADETEEDVDHWTDTITESVKPYEASMTAFEEEITTRDKEIQEQQRNDKIEFEAMLKAKLRVDEEQAEREKQAQKEKFILDLERKKLELSEKKRMQTKLPDLQITKFQGTHLDWVRFWNIFQAQIDSAPMSETAKFSYLKELVTPKVRITIDKLPVTSEGYAKAKKILEQRYGDPAEVTNAHIQQIIALPVIHGRPRAKIHEFYDQLQCNVQALDTMGQLGTVSGNVRMTLDKLEGIRADITRADNKWKEWSFQDLLEALHQWIDRNPIQPGERDVRTQPRDQRRDRTFAASEQIKPRACVYCNKQEHKSINCEAVPTLEERRKILSSKRLCFNCTGEKHRAQECRSKTTCQVCQRRHHTSICDKKQSETAMTATNEKAVVHPVVVVKVEGIKCRALLDTGASNTYVSSTIVELAKKKPIKREHKSVEMMLGTVNKTINIYEIEISDINRNFVIKSEVNGVERPNLLQLPNPNYGEVIKANKHLTGVNMDDTDRKETLPIHVILGANNYSLIKTTTAPRIGELGQPVAEKTKFGWAIMSPGKNTSDATLMLATNPHEDYIRLCSLDVLGVEDKPEGDQLNVYEEFKEQLVQREDGRYETSLPWKPGHPNLPTNKKLALGRLNSLLRRLDKNPELFKAYDEIINNQLKEGIIEVAEEKVQGKEHYIPHKPVIREKAESTKVRIVYDASAKETQESAALNECLNVGPPLQRKIFDILIRVRFNPILLAGDIKQAFLQIFIREAERDALRFFWIQDIESKQPIIYRVTRVLFGLGPSPFLLGGTLEQHLEKFEIEYPETVRKINEGIFVDDINLVGESVEQVRDLKETSKEIFRKGGFELHKWHCNEPELDGESSNDGEPTYAKESLGTKPSETKLLGVKWDKGKDTLSITFPESEEQPTKRVVLSTIGRIYDPIGIAAPALLTGKQIFREICERKIPWDAVLPDDIKNRWIKWLKNLPSELTIPRAIALQQQQTTAIELHGFADASMLGCCAAVYAVVRQGDEVNQQLLVAKSRLAKRDLTIPRLELVSCHMTCNLLENTAKVLQNYPVISVPAWSDSTVCLYWIQGAGKYKQFVANRVAKINQRQLAWRHVPTSVNPADIGSRGETKLQEKELWLKGPTWLSTPEQWPPMIACEPSSESESEKHLMKQIMQTAIVRESDEIDLLIEKKSFWQSLRILAWMKRFIENCKRVKAKRLKSPLTTDEIEQQKRFLTKRVQSDVEANLQFENERAKLNLQKDSDGIYRCMGRIQGVYPVYLPFEHIISQKLVEWAHYQTLHGGVSMTMSKVRDSYWIPKLRSIVKKVIKQCHGCKRFHATPMPDPPPGKSHLERPIQFLYPLELHCDRAVQSDIKMNPEAGEFRPKRKAALEAAANFQGTFEYKEDNVL